MLCARGVDCAAIQHRLTHHAHIGGTHHRIVEGHAAAGERGVAYQTHHVVEGLSSRGVYGGGVDQHHPARIGGQAAQGRGVTHGGVKPRGACGVDCQALCTVDSAAQGHGTCTCVEHRVSPQGHRCGVVLCTCGGDAATVERRQARHLQSTGACDGGIEGDGRGVERGVTRHLHSVVINLCPACGDASTLNHHAVTCRCGLNAVTSHVGLHAGGVYRAHKGGHAFAVDHHITQRLGGC